MYAAANFDAYTNVMDAMTGEAGANRAKGWNARALRNLVFGRPVLAIFEINYTCNSACGYCDLPLNQGRPEMTRAQIRRVFEGARDFGVSHVFIQGGEPLLRADLCDIMEDLAGLGLGMSLVTNGTKFSPDLVARLSRLPVSISVSLDTLDRETYRRIRGADQLPRVLAGIAMLKAFSGPKYLTAIVSRANREDVRDVARFAWRNGLVPIFGAYHWDVGRYGKADAALEITAGDAADVFRGLLASGLVPPGYLRNFVKDNLNWVMGRRLAPCDAGKYSIAIDAAGNLSPCLAHRAAGNLLETPFGEVLAAVDRGMVKRCSRASSCNLLCSRIVGASLRNPVAAVIAGKRSRATPLAAAGT